MDAAAIDTHLTALPAAAVTAVNERPFGSALYPWIASWHQAPRRLGPMALDAAIAAVVAWVVTASVGASAVSTGALLTAGLLFGVWKRRMPMQTQGVLWFARPFVPAAAVAGAAVWAWSGATDGAWAFGLMCAALLAVRVALWVSIGRARRRGRGLQRTLVVGPSHRIRHIEHRMSVFPEAGLEFTAAYIPAHGDGASHEAGRDLVDRLLTSHSIEHVLFVADDIHERVFREFLRYGGGRADFSMVLPLGPVIVNQTRARLGDLGVVPIQLLQSWGSLAAKRVFDVVASSLALLLISPVLAATALAIRLDTPGPAIFKQQRVGRNGRTFTIFKFRSMVDGAEHLRDDYLEHNVNEHLLFKLKGDPRITRVGKLIRRLSVDELPQLFNVLRGEMSLVGPRPLPVDPDDFDSGAQIRHWVLPGITGLWQVHGANALSYRDMVGLDLSYVATRTLAVDLGLVLRTVPALIIRRSGAY
jgi:lipopolysaccharide/colanic/teichoic acid biosynthesis glycosyltransferase/uncharacterized RDD family membrane protein YckC